MVIIITTEKVLLEKNRKAYSHVLQAVNQMGKLHKSGNWKAAGRIADNLNKWVDKNWGTPFVRLAFSNELKDWYWTLTRYYWKKEMEYLPRLKKEVIGVREYANKKYLKNAERYKYGSTIYMG